MFQLTDHRGKDHLLALDELPAEARRNSSTQLRQVRGCCIFAVAGCLMLLIQQLAQSLLGVTNLPTYLSWTIAVGVIIAAIAIDRVLSTRPWWYGPAAIQAHYRAMLARSCCPVCTYSLDGVSPERDGCRVCPECAAAWRLRGDSAGNTG